MNEYADHMSFNSPGTLKVYLPDGHLYTGGLGKIWNATGLPYPSRDPGFVVIEDGELHGSHGFPRNHVDKLVLVLRRPHNIPKSVKSSNGIGISGKDFWVDRLGLPPENGMDKLDELGMYNLLDLRCRPSSILSCYPERDHVRTSGDVRSAIGRYASAREGKAVIATEFPQLTYNTLVEMFGVNPAMFEIFGTDGKTETFVPVGDADGVFDVVETGKSVMENGMRAVSPAIINPSTPHVVIRRTLYREHEPVVEELVNRLKIGMTELMNDEPAAFAGKLNHEVFA